LRRLADDFSAAETRLLPMYRRDGDDFREACAQGSFIYILGVLTQSVQESFFPRRIFCLKLDKTGHFFQ